MRQKKQLSTAADHVNQVTLDSCMVNKGRLSVKTAQHCYANIANRNITFLHTEKT
jgi:hypothetical protein